MTRNEPATGPRYDMYYAIHKAIRHAHCTLLMRLSAFDLDDDAAVAETIEAMRAHFILCKGHLKHEDKEIHPALESRRPGATQVAEEGHDDHVASFVELETLLQDLIKAPRASRAAAAHALYRRFALFMADDFIHMNEEETVLQAALQEAFSDDELMAIEHRIVANIPADESPLSMRPMMAAMRPDERRTMLAGMKQGMPAMVFDMLMSGLVRPNIPAVEWNALADLRA